MAQQVIVVDENGLSLVADDVGLGWQVPWRDVVEIRGFKRGLLTTDLTCLEVASVTGLRLELHEEMTGWDALLDALPQRLPGAMGAAELFQALVKPPFAPNETIVYRAG